LVEYFELKITDNQSDDFLRMLSKMTYHFPKKNLRKSYLADLQKKDLRKSSDKLSKNLTKNLTKFRKLGSSATRADLTGRWAGLCSAVFRSRPVNPVRESVIAL